LKFWGSIDISGNLPSGEPMLRLDLVLEQADGRKTVIATDAAGAGWEVADGPYLRNNIYLGTVYDGRREATKVWSSKGVSAVTPATLSSIGVLTPALIPPIRAFELLPGVRSGVGDADGAVVYDMGRNFAGTVNITLVGALESGATIDFLYGEILFPNGSVNGLTSVAGQIKGPGQGGKCAPDVAYQRDSYISGGLDANERVSFIPKFTWHGFRYVAVSISGEAWT